MSLDCVKFPPGRSIKIRYKIKELMSVDEIWWKSRVSCAEFIGQLEIFIN